MPNEKYLIILIKYEVAPMVDWCVNMHISTNGFHFCRLDRCSHGEIVTEALNPHYNGSRRHILMKAMYKEVVPTSNDRQRSDTEADWYVDRQTTYKQYTTTRSPPTPHHHHALCLIVLSICHLPHELSRQVAGDVSPVSQTVSLPSFYISSATRDQNWSWLDHQ